MNVTRYIRKKFKISLKQSTPFMARVGKREQIAELFAELGFKTGAEIGVWTGKFSRHLCDTIPGLKLHCIDPWKAYNRVSDRVANEAFRQAKKRLEGQNVEFSRMESHKAAKLFADEFFDFIYIDGKHEFDWIMLDLILWNAKVRDGGIISVHDYNLSYHQGVIKAVNAFTRAHNIYEWYITRERGTPSAFWVKQKELPRNIFKLS